MGWSSHTLDTSIDGSDVQVDFEYHPAVPGRMYMRNGDPGYPDEPAEVEILSVIRDGDKLDFDKLPKGEQDDLLDRCHQYAKQSIYDYAD